MTSLREKLQDFFKTTDANENGTLYKEELRKGVHGLLGVEFDDKMLDAMIKQADKNGDGKIQCDEFCDIVEKSMQ